MSISSDPIRLLRRLLEYTPHPDVNQMIRERDHVLRRYSGMFAPDAVAAITAEQFREFLLFENNQHWWGLQRDEARMTHNTDLLRWALSTLVDETRPIEERIDEIDADGRPSVPGLDRTVYTPILLVSQPGSYGVWNSISESAMTRLGLWPDLDGAGSNGARYAAVNDMILTVAAELDTDPWTLDAIWWAVEKEHDPGSHFTSRRPGPAPRTKPAAKSARPTTASRRPARPQPATFVCRNCFQQKPLNLASDDPDLCVDCA